MNLTRLLATALLAFSTVDLTGCASGPPPQPGHGLNEPPDYLPIGTMTQSDAVALLRSELPSSFYLVRTSASERGVSITTISSVNVANPAANRPVSDILFVTSDKELNGKRYLGLVKFFFVKDLLPVARLGGTEHWASISLSSDWYLEAPAETVPWDTVRRVANALAALKNQAAYGQHEFDAGFADVVLKMRSMSHKPELPEGARAAMVKAEQAVDGRRYLDASEYYWEALNQAPWWPDGYFNLATVLAAQHDYEDAIRSMGYYLALAPESGDARAAKDKTYQWQDGEYWVLGTPVPVAPAQQAVAQGGGDCFIATAAYGTALEPHVRALREFRDRHLLTSTLGRRFVAFYYRYSPPIADYIRERPGMRAVVRAILAPVVLTVANPAGALECMIVLLAGTLLISRYLRSRNP